MQRHLTLYVSRSAGLTVVVRCRTTKLVIHAFCNTELIVAAFYHVSSMCHQGDIYVTLSSANETFVILTCGADAMGSID